MVLHSSRTFLLSKFSCDTQRNWSRFLLTRVVKSLTFFMSVNYFPGCWSLASIQGQIQDFLGGGAPLRNGVTDWWPDVNTSCIRKPQVISRVGGGGTHPLIRPWYLLVIICIFCILICSPHGKTRFYSRTFEQLVQPQILLLGEDNGWCSIPGEDHEGLLVIFLSGLAIQSLSRVTCWYLLVQRRSLLNRHLRT